MKFTIYRWTNKLNGKVYIGQTSYDLKERFAVHITLSKTGSRYKFHQAIRKHGVDGFITETLATTDNLQDALKLECKYIAEHDSFRNGYNMTLGGQGAPCSPEKAKKISDAKKGKPLPHMKTQRNTLGWKWYNNGTDNLLVAPNETPEGYVKGRINKPGIRLNGTKRPKFPTGYAKSTET